jgi:hypothetical protein
LVVGARCRPAVSAPRLLVNPALACLCRPAPGPRGLDPFVGKVVPLLQERGVFRTEYEGTTLRENLGLAPLGAVKTAQVAS